MSLIFKITRISGIGSLVLCLLITTSQGRAADVPDFETQIAPLLTKYCAGCHNPEDAESELSLDSYADLIEGGESGSVITPGNSNSSRLIGVLTGRVEPKMPPEEEEAPTEEEIGLLETWIESGAKGPAGSNPTRRRLITPELPAVDSPAAVTAVDFSPDGKLLAVARFGRIELKPFDRKQVDGDASRQKILDHPGKVQSVHFSGDGQFLLTATGVTGLYGEARFWNTTEGALVRTYPGNEHHDHGDILYAAISSPDGSLLATAGYDRKIILWNRETGEVAGKLEGHNGAVFDLAFSADGKLLVSASADTTVKVWHVESGRRLDTRSEPLKEQYTTAISPDGRLLVAGGEDNRIRVWQLVSTDQPKINPLVLTRFAHEGSITLLRFSEDGRFLVSAGMDGEVKLWETEDFRQIHSWPKQPASVQAVAISSTAGQVAAGRMDGSLELYPLPDDLSHDSPVVSAEKERMPAPLPTGLVSQLVEAEPNGSPTQAQAVVAPARIRGVIRERASEPSAENQSTDVDYFRFTSAANQTWIVEVRAERDKSPLDSRIEVLDTDGQSIPRVVLQATYDSYFTFRGKNSDQDDDFRLHNWREMRLNEYLYCNGEVVKFYHYPRGPDSGFKVYSNSGKRRGYFDTTPITHPLNEPCYIVNPFRPDEPIVPNGLPTFVVNYENDDDSLRRVGGDSYLTFTAPQEGQYLVRLSDVRGQGGSDYRYELVVRAPRRDFKIKSVIQEEPEVMAGSGHKFGVEVDRQDGFDGPVTIHIEGLPSDFTTHSPLVVQAGQQRAWGTILAAADAETLTEEDASAIKLVAVANLDGREISKWPHEFGKLELKPKSQLHVSVVPNQPDPPLKDGLPVVEITPGTTTTFLARVERDGYEGRVTFGKQDAARNSPHGVYVDNIGLNGVQIQEKENERLIFLTAEPWVEPQERMIFLEAEEAGKPTSQPLWLRVVPLNTAVANR